MFKMRKASKKDLPQLKKFCFEAHKELAKFSKDIIVNKQTKKEAYREIDALFKDSFTETFVAEKNSKIVGNVNVFFAPGLRKEGTIFNLFVVRTQRRKGVASKLIVAASEWLKKRGVKTVRIIVHKKNKVALSFLKKLKFNKEPIKVFWLIKSI